MADFSKEDKEFEGGAGNYFGFGVHKVEIIGFDIGVSNNGVDFIKVGFIDPENNDCQDSQKVYFSDKAKKYSFDKLRSVFVHNAPEAQKDAARKAVDAVKNHTELAELLTKKLIGKEMWFTKYNSLTQTYTDQSGVIKPSIQTDIMGYEPKLKPELMPKPKESVVSAGEAVFAEPESPQDELPWS